jgi:hypothetical protein
MKALRIVVTALFLTIIATSAFAASLSHTPDSTYVEIAAGSDAEVPITVSMTDVQGTYYLWFVDSVKGNLPQKWIKPKKSNTFLNSFWDSASTDLVVSVPEDAEPGIYSGYVYSKAMKSHEYADPGKGMLLKVMVPSRCLGAPEVEITGFGPDEIWPPDQRMNVVTVSGVVKMPYGCTLYEAGYSIEDEYGVFTGEGEFTVNDNGEFSVNLPVQAWRKGKDPDGRHYRIKLFAGNGAGIGTSAVLDAVVPHDKGKRTNAK